MNKEFFSALDDLEREKGISKEYMLEKVEAALQNAIRREIGATAQVRVVLNPDKNDLKAYQQRTVVEEVEDPLCEISHDEVKAMGKRTKVGGVVETELKLKDFRRLSAQAAKQVIIQGIREAERANLVRAYEDKKEEIITATIYKIDETNGNLILDVGKGTAVLQKAEQIPGEIHGTGDQIKVYISEVRAGDTRGPIILLSRVHPGFVRRLFEMQIPEIADGTVRIMGVSRDAGSRTKIAVWSEDENVDAIGACIGQGGMRIASILGELSNEKIDIIQYSPVPEEYVAQALSPAVVQSVVMDGERSCRVTVSPGQLSLAIGREGQNARLAAKLTGYKIDIKT
ncbi:MAG: transcription termination/antitermination protein NusA [Clostridia bacterium]|nr:transcription termination/antitermination protein NusA [Clostridia bacterium]